MRHFFAVLSRMKHIRRWGLMRCTREENLCEHSFETAVLAHALALLRNERFGGSVSPERAAALALFHDASEIFTGDLPTPVKYDNPALRSAYAQVESHARSRLLSMLPEDLRPAYRPLLEEGGPDEEELRRIVKAADKLSALIKCMEERRAGNAEFSRAEQTLRRAVEDMHLPEADCFLTEFLPSYALTLDEQEGDPTEITEGKDTDSYEREL
ncbi:MAG TPA: 5'-deoxynucleotidase [Candidatus Caccousia avicola]|uniref:5'-deoxynucleotidase n=1 Tax=Candidatus Caccousia avicola TaxID=2840721 RepID=A0A9D1DEM9_9FIRM|nr:5'-deoxynucleotidase [Candidatus Caccousia avicola]